MCLGDSLYKVHHVNNARSDGQATGRIMRVCTNSPTVVHVTVYLLKRYKTVKDEYKTRAEFIHFNVHCLSLGMLVNALLLYFR